MNREDLAAHTSFASNRTRLDAMILACVPDLASPCVLDATLVGREQAIFSLLRLPAANLFSNFWPPYMKLLIP
jgi:hypothetical protein